MTADPQLRQSASFNFFTHRPHRQQRNAHPAFDHELDEIRVVRFKRQIRPHPDVIKKLIRRAPDRSAALKQDQAFTLNVRNRHGLFAGQPVFLPDDQHQFVIKKFRYLQRGRVNRERRKADIRRAVQNIRDGLLGADRCAKRQLDAWMRAHK